MIIKMTPIKGPYGNLTSACNYILDMNKTVTSINASLNDTLTNVKRFHLYNAESRKIENTLVSCVGCTPYSIRADFMAQSLNNQNKRMKINSHEVYTIAYSLIQSFPADMEISDEKVHECGRRLLFELGVQGVVASHVNPQINERDGKLHGKQKHNHIIANAFLPENMLDEQRPNRIKINSDKKFYAHLQALNDRIAIDNGLPIYRTVKPSNIGWFEAQKINEGDSFKEKIRKDIDKTIQEVTDWEEFKIAMDEKGYTIKDTNTTFVDRLDNHTVRGERLGWCYTKKALCQYLKLRKGEISDKNISANPEKICRWEDKEQEELFVDFPIGDLSLKNKEFYTMKMEKGKYDRKILNTYFFSTWIYPLKNLEGKIVGTCNGKEIIQYMAKKEREILNRKITYAENRKREKQNLQFQGYEERYTNLYDKDGRRRTIVDLIFLLVIEKLKRDNRECVERYVPKRSGDEVCFGPPLWKAQNMMDSLALAEKEGLKTPAEIDARVNEAWKDYVYAKNDVTKASAIMIKMKDTVDAINEYVSVRDMIDEIGSLSDENEKENAKRVHAEEIRRYHKSLEIMLDNNITTTQQIDNYLYRYESIKRKLPEMEKIMEEKRKEYKQIRKMQYYFRMAEMEIRENNIIYPGTSLPKGDTRREKAR